MGRKARPLSEAKTCVACERPVKAKGLCLRHYCATYSNGPCAFPGCQRRARAMHLCQSHYMRKYRCSTPSPIVDVARKSPSSPYVTDCSEASSCGDCTDSAAPSCSATPRTDVSFALQADVLGGTQGDIAYGEYWRFSSDGQAVRRPFGEESSPAGGASDPVSM